MGWDVDPTKLVLYWIFSYYRSCFIYVVYPKTSCVCNFLNDKWLWTWKSQKAISKAQLLSFLLLSLNEGKVTITDMLKVAHANMCANLKHAVLVSAHFHIYQLISAISNTNMYRKRPCISCTFFTKLKPKIKGAAYPWIHLYLEFSKT